MQPYQLIVTPPNFAKKKKITLFIYIFPISLVQIHMIPIRKSVIKFMNNGNFLNNP